MRRAAAPISRRWGWAAAQLAAGRRRGSSPAGAAEQLSEVKQFGGVWRRYRHRSATVSAAMEFAVFLPPAAAAGGATPAMLWLSGLTCTDANFREKAGGARAAAHHGVALILPDTSPRGDDVPRAAAGEPVEYDFGHGAGFYLNAAAEPFRQHYNMHDYVVRELPAVVSTLLPQLCGSSWAISGHSMGGHGALTLALRNPGLYRSVSAFAPICSTTRCPWGRKALSRYIGPDESLWGEWDASLLAPAYSGPPLKLLVSQGAADNFLEQQLRPELLLEGVFHNPRLELDLRVDQGYDHSYYYMSTFIDDHIAFHAQQLKSGGRWL
eukprot:TRINITY_DN2882_c0_g1_i1.p2 TRINITY_DN2882_c0_g1~~TRINITY_DN2882_c0_g1_i1.p2  ORF type:complete len:365 (+),score=102.24 TRINITY_DN2882_c0_g1_i1:124-1095(+)